MSAEPPAEELGTWHDDTLNDIERCLRSYVNSLEMEIARGSRRGSDLLVRHRETGRCVRIEVQAQPWRPLSEAKGWAKRHVLSDTVATFVVCPEAHLAKAIHSIRSEVPSFGSATTLFFFDDKRIEQLAATIFALLCRP